MRYKTITAVTTEPVTLAEARLQLRLTPGDSTAEDSLITAWITTAREVAEAYTGRALAPQVLEAAADCFPPCAQVLELPRPPVTSVTSIKYTDQAGVEQTLAPVAYSLSTYGDSRTITPAPNTSWPATQAIPDAVRVRFAAGYGGDTPAPGLETPRAVKAAILLMVTWLYENRGSEQSVNDIQPPAAKALLNTVKLWGH